MTNSRGKDEMFDDASRGIDHHETMVHESEDKSEVPDEIDNQISYQASKPTTLKSTWAKRIAARVLFPPILLWDGLKFAVNKMVGKWACSIVMQSTGGAVYTQKNTQQTIKNYMQVYHNSFSANFYNVRTYDGAELDTVEFLSEKQKSKAIQDQKFIIKFNGNATVYEDILGNVAGETANLEQNIVCFNYRNVGNSNKKAASSIHDYVIDGIAQVDRLLKQGVDPENITLDGHSLGGAIASVVAKYFHDRGIKVNLFNDRSFSNLTNVIVGWIRTLGTRTGHQETTKRKILGWMAKPFIKFGLALAKVEIEAAEAYKAIPSTHKEYMVVRTRKCFKHLYLEKAKENTKQISAAYDEEGMPYPNNMSPIPTLETAGPSDDPVIPHYGSLHSSLKSERKEQKAHLKQVRRIVQKKIDLDPNNQKKLAIREGLLAAQDHLKHRKMTTDEYNAHGSDRGSLIYCKNDQPNEDDDKYCNNGNTFFRQFLKQIDKHHANEKERRANMRNARKGS